MEDIMTLSAADVEKTIGSWYAHPLTRFLVEVAKDNLKHNLTGAGPAIRSASTGIEYTAGYLAGENKLLHDIINPKDWVFDEIWQRKLTGELNNE